MTEENNCLYTANRDNLTVHSTPRTMAMAMQANEWASLCLTRGSEDSFTSSLLKMVLRVVLVIQAAKAGDPW